LGGWGARRIWFGEDTVVTREREKHVKKITPEICAFDDKEIVWMCRGGDKGDQGAAVEMRFLVRGKRQWRGIRKGWWIVLCGQRSYC